jgi:nitroreductase
MVSGIEMLELISQRQSDRKYNDRQVEQEKLDRIIEAGRLAPSACNAQPWKFIVVNDPEVLAGVAAAASAKLLGMNTFVAQARVFIVIVRENPNISSKIGGGVKDKDYSYIDIGITTENICLQAKAEGLGSCIIGWFDESSMRKVLKIPSSKRIPVIISIGYPEGETREKRRKPADQTVSFNSY